MTDGPDLDPGTLDVRFPPGQWIPNPGQLHDSARTLLAVAGQALDLYGNGELYRRRVIAHGSTIPLVPRANQLVVGCTGVFPGQAGRRLYQFPEGALGKVALTYAQFFVDVTGVWPVPTGGLSASLQSAEDLSSAAAFIWSDALIVWSSLRALGLGGVTPSPSPIEQDNLLVTTFEPHGPRGGLAGWTIQVEIQL